MCKGSKRTGSKEEKIRRPNYVVLLEVFTIYQEAKQVQEAVRSADNCIRNI